MDMLLKKGYIRDDNKYFNSAKNCSILMLSLVNGILDYSQYEAGKL